MSRKHPLILPVVLAACVAIGSFDRSFAEATSPEVEALRKKLASELTYSRRLAVEKLGRLGTEAESAVPDLVTALENDSDEMVRLRSAWALGEIKQSERKTVAALLMATRDLNRGVAANALMALHSLGIPAVPRLEEALLVKDAQVRLAAARTLWGLGRKPDEASLSAVRSAFDDPSPEVRQLAANCAALAGAEALPLVPKLITLLDDPEAAVREVTAVSLSKLDLGGNSESALIRVLKQDSSKGARRAAAMALGKIGGPREQRIQALLGSLDDQDKDVRGTSSRSMSQLGAVAVPLLLDSLKSNKSSIRELTVDSLLELGPKAQPAVDPLIGLLHSDPEGSVRFRTAGALGAIGDASPKVLEALEASVAGDKDPTVRAHAISALRALRPGVSDPSES
jgi:HEAT repeat protein